MPAVLPSNKECPALLEHPEAEESLEEVVDNQDSFDIIRLSILHELRAKNLDHIDIGNTDECRRPDRGHQEPVIDSWVSQVHHKVVVGAHNLVDPASIAITNIHLGSKRSLFNQSRMVTNHIYDNKLFKETQISSSSGGVLAVHSSRRNMIINTMFLSLSVLQGVMLGLINCQLRPGRLDDLPPFLGLRIDQDKKE